jgi:hypothetical protein
MPPAPALTDRGAWPEPQGGSSVPDVIDSLDRARALVEELVEALPECPPSDPDRGPHDPPSGDEMRAFAEWHAIEIAAADFLVEALDWDAGLLGELLAEEELRAGLRPANDIISYALSNAEEASADPHVRLGESVSRAESLARKALRGDRLAPRYWRRCDVDAAVGLLPFEFIRMVNEAETSPEYYEFPGGIASARFSLLAFEPAMPDRRAAQ